MISRSPGTASVAAGTLQISTPPSRSTLHRAQVELLLVEGDGRRIVRHGCGRASRSGHPTRAVARSARRPRRRPFLAAPLGGHSRSARGVGLGAGAEGGLRRLRPGDRWQADGRRRNRQRGKRNRQRQRRRGRGWLGGRRRRGPWGRPRSGLRGRQVGGMHDDLNGGTPSLLRVVAVLAAVRVVRTTWSVRPPRAWRLDRERHRLQCESSTAALAPDQTVLPARTTTPVTAGRTDRASLTT